MKQAKKRTSVFSIASAVLLVSLVFFGSSTFAQTSVIDDSNADRGTTIKLMSNNQLPKKVLVMCTPDTSDFVKELFNIVARIHEEDSLSGDDSFILHVLPQRGGFSNIFTALSNPDKIAAFFKTTKEKAAKLVEVNSEIGSNDIWMQDFAEFCASIENGKAVPAIFDVGRGRGLDGFAKWFAEAWQLKYFNNPSNAHAGGDYGGNIEVTPDNILFHGDTMTPACRNFLLENGYKGREIQLNTSWLAVGHIDEYMMIIPTKFSPCGYSLVRSDPWYAMELLKSASPSDFEGMPEPYKSFLPRVQAALNDPQAWKETKEALFIELNRKIGEIIEENVGKFVQEVRNITGDSEREIPTVAWPNLFRSEDQANMKRCVAYTPGVVNHLVLRDHLIVPDPFFPPFRKMVEARFRSQGNKVHFLNDLAYHDLMGEVHCGTNVVRDPNRVMVTPKITAAVSVLKADFARLHGDNQEARH